MIDGADTKPADIDRLVSEHLDAAGPFDSADFDPEVLRDIFALVERWRSVLRAHAPPYQDEPSPPGEHP
jgi:hypothetical protein